MAIPMRSVHGTLVHQHRALETPNTFRLLRLHAGQGEKISGSLHHHILGSEACPSYRAVSYTWGKGSAHHTLHLEGGSGIQVRKNLWNILQSIRDKESSCWLWIDAICINQRLDEERNHHVRLMSDIYGKANVVLVWLQSAEESANVSRAFKFVHAAATHDRSTQSVLNYSREHALEGKKDWQSLKRLCRLRYWTRKWIIQEVVFARTVVLHRGDLECSMADFEVLCGELQREKDNTAYEKWKPGVILASPAARLALQRLEPVDVHRQRLLYQLIHRYANNACQLPCDHVYALHSLVGEHRTHLRIDYGATAIQRLVEVLGFVREHEHLHPSKVLELANVLVRLFRIKPETVLQERRSPNDLTLVAVAETLGTVELQAESNGSRVLRRKVARLDPIPRFTLENTDNGWSLMRDVGQGDLPEPMAQQDMAYFTIRQSGLHGLAACRLEAGDAITHFPTTQLVFAVRRDRVTGQTATILGRAYLFCAADDADGFEFWLSRQVRLQGHTNPDMSGIGPGTCRTNR